MPETEPSEQAQDKRILVIDQEPAILRLFELALSEQGFTPHIASCTTDALEVCVAHELQIVLADVDSMGREGRELIARIRQVRPNICIFLMTAGSPSYGTGDLESLGVKHYFTKPISLAQLFAFMEHE